MPEAYITVRSQKMGLDYATVRSRVFWGLLYGPVPEKKTGPCRSPVQSFLETVIWSGPVRGPTVRSGQSTNNGYLLPVKFADSLVHVIACYRSRLQ